MSFSVYFFHSELYSELDNPIVMENPCYSANKESEDAYDVSTSHTGYEPNLLTFGELNDSSVPFSFMISSSDQDMDDVTLGKLLTEAHRGQADYCEPEGMPVSLSSSVVFDGSGQPDGEMSTDQGNLTSETARTHRSGLYMKSRDKRLSRNIEKKSVIMNSNQLTQKKSADSYENKLWRQKLEFREADQQGLAEMEELRKFQSSTFDTIARRKLIEDQNTILELSGRVHELQNEVNCMNDS